MLRIDKSLLRISFFAKNAIATRQILNASPKNVSSLVCVSRPLRQSVCEACAPAQYYLT